MEKEERINQNQIFDLITGDELSWQSIIYDLIKTEQLDPWDINIGVLADRYVETIQQLEEANFFISSKVLLACSLLLRLKSEILLNNFIKNLDEALYGKKEEEKYGLERIEIDEEELPVLTPKSPIARHKKVTLKELMNALNKAIETETRRIKKEIRVHQAKKAADIVLPKTTRVPLKIRIKKIMMIISNHINQGNKTMKFSHLAPEKEEKLASFVPILHLSNDGRIHIWQKIHFDEIYLGLEKHPEEIEILKQELELAGEN